MARKPSAKPRATKKIKIEHTRAPYFRTYFVDGSFIRRDKDTFVLTFFSNDQLVVSQEGEQRKEDSGATAYRVTGINELPPSRIQEAAIRLTINEGISLARVIVEQAVAYNPELVKELGFTAIQKDGS